MGNRGDKDSHSFKEGTPHYLWSLYRQHFWGKFNIPAPKWNIKDWKLWTKLIDELTYDKVNEFFNFVVDNWTVIKIKLKITGYPTVPVLWSFRYPIMDLWLQNKMKKQIQNVKLQKSFLELLRNNFCELNAFYIFGSPARKSNSRIFTGSSFVLGKSAQKYINIFSKQIKRINVDTPYDELYEKDSLLWVFELWYNNVRSDASIELIFDLLQEYKVIVNDNNIRNYFVFSNIDYILPRAKITIYNLLNNIKENNTNEKI